MDDEYLKGIRNRDNSMLEKAMTERPMDDVEKVARAIWMASRPINPAGILNWDAMLDEYKEQWRVYARAALSALDGWNEAIEARPLNEWHEDYGPALWFFFPISEPPYCGSPLDDDWPGYHTHWIRLPDASRIRPAAEGEG